MPNDLELFQQGGELQPYSPSQPLTPVQQDWDIQPDYSRDLQTQQQPTFFGTPMQCTPEQLDQLVGEISGVFISDMSRLRHPRKVINAAVAWFSANFDQPIRQERKNHNYNLHDQQNDPLANSFANQMQYVGATQELISNALWWLGELAKRSQNSAVSADTPVPRTAPSSSDPTDQLSDKEYQAVVAANEAASARTMDYLRNHWGQSFRINLKLVQDYFAKLPPAHQRHLDQFTSGWIKGTNTKEVILALFNEAIGSVPTAPANINAEIAALENIMRNERKRWNNDESLGARYRQLLDMRGGR